MRKIKKVLKYTGIVLLVLIIGLAIVVAFRQNLTFEAPYPAITASTDSAVIAHGKELVLGAANCAECHASKNIDSLIQLGQEVPLAGGREFDLPFGTIRVKNITSDQEYGIGKLSDQEIARTLRYGVDSKGHAALMPLQNFSDEDLTAVISYLRTQAPVKKEIAASDFNVMGKVVKAFLIKPGGLKNVPPAGIKKDTTAAYGEYLAINVSDCRGCHTRGEMLGDLTGVPFSGGGEMADTKTGKTMVSPNLTQHKSSAIYQWSKEMFIARFRKGRQIPGSEMPWESYRRMSDNDLTAIYHFLRSLPPTPFDTPAKK